MTASGVDGPREAGPRVDRGAGVVAEQEAGASREVAANQEAAAEGGRRLDQCVRRPSSRHSIVRSFSRLTGFPRFSERSV